MTVPLAKNFREFLESITSHDVIFMVIGGYAVAWHGRARTTEDIDIWIEPSIENIERMIKALNDFFGEGFVDMTPERFLESKVKQIGAPPWRVDILVRVTGLEFSECYPNRESWPVGDSSYPIISLPDLRKAKLAAGRPKDLVDLREFLPPED